MNRKQILDELRSELKVGNHIIGVAINCWYNSKVCEAGWC